MWDSVPYFTADSWSLGCKRKVRRAEDTTLVVIGSSLSSVIRKSRVAKHKVTSDNVTSS